MKFVGFFLGALFFFGHQVAKAQVPYSSLDQLRAKTVVVRVALDSPQSPKLKACGLKEIPFAKLGAELALQTENFKATWAKEHLYAPDLKEIKRKVSVCEVRGSCSAYAEFLGSVHGAEADVQKEMGRLKKNLDLKLSKMKSQSYATAWLSVPKPCEVLKELLKSAN